MKIGIVKESYPGERRVALVPQAMRTLNKLKVELLVESGAGESAGFLDQSYRDAGAEVVLTRSKVFERADAIALVRAVNANPDQGQADVALLREGQCLIAQCDPLWDPAAMVSLASRKALVFALELMPRITRAQSMDVLSSMATIYGYKGVLLAANHSPQMFPMMTTAAGTLAPAKVFVMGAGVAGLQAIATARRLGAVVSAYDVRPEVKEQVQSLGGKFVEIELAAAEGEGGYAKEMNEEFYRKQRELLLKVVAESDVVITTAAIPGKKSPILLTAEMVHAMPAGSVIVDLAAERGGNCELTKPGETVVTKGVKVIGPLNLASEAPRHASQMYSNNVTAFLKELVKDGKLTIDLTNEVVRDTLVTHRGKCVNAKVRELAGLTPLAEEEAAERKSAAASTAFAEPTSPETIFGGGDSEDGSSYRLSGR